MVPRGAGSGLSGGSSAVAGGIVVSLDRMRAVHIDPDYRVAVVEPGALNAEVKAAAREHGLWYPPDPSSFEICSIGGNIATNAGGLCCVKYGVTTDYVLGLDVVLADGTAISLGGPRLKDVAGLSLRKLFVGSEGTLGVITRAVLRLVPAQQPPSTLVASFAGVPAAAEAVVAISRSGRPAMLELMDRASINAVEDYLSMGLDRTAGALLVAQSDAGLGAPRRDRRDRRGVPGLRCDRGVQHRRPRRGRGVRDGPPGGVPGDRAARHADAGGRRRGGAAAAGAAGRHRRDRRHATRSRSRPSRTPGTATPTRSSSTTRPTRTRPPGPAPPSPRSWRWRSRWAAPSPASTASGG